MDNLPSAKIFFDVFFGGGAITHRALLSAKYEQFIVNDIDGRLPKLFLDCCYGKYTVDNHKEWISREDFFRLKDEDAYIALVWSFGNNGVDYLYAKDLEPFKKALHYAIFFNDLSLMEQQGIPLKDTDETRIYERYLFFKHQLEIMKRQPVYEENLTRAIEIERLQSLQSLQDDYQVAVEKVNRQYAENKGDVLLYCFDTQTEVLTGRGWINIKDVILGDVCLSREPNTGVLEWKKVVNLISYFHDGYMYEYEGKNVSLCVTPNHRMFVSGKHCRKEIRYDEFIEAEKLFKTPSNYAFISANGKWEVTDELDTIEICEDRFNKKDFAYLLGIFLTDGSVNNQGSITISQTKDHIKKKIVDTLHNMKIKFSEYTTKRSPHHVTYYIPRKYLPFFKQFYLKENRTIPKEFKEWGKEYLEALMEGIIDGDSDNGRRRIFCGSLSLLNDIQEICYKIGLSANIRIKEGRIKYLEKENRYIVPKKPYYILSINRKPYLSIIKNNIRKIEYCDNVYCVTLEDWHTVLVRRNGKPVWCGQCDPPYSSTNCGKYKGFDNERFYEWARKQDNIYISEYNMPDDFIPIAWKEKPVLSAAIGNDLKAIEKIYTNERTYSRLDKETRQRINLNFSEQMSLFDFIGANGK